MIRRCTRRIDRNKVGSGDYSVALCAAQEFYGLWGLLLGTPKVGTEPALTHSPPLLWDLDDKLSHLCLVLPLHICAIMSPRDQRLQSQARM